MSKAQRHGETQEAGERAPGRNLDRGEEDTDDPSLEKDQDTTRDLAQSLVGQDLIQSLVGQDLIQSPAGQDHAQSLVDQHLTKNLVDQHLAQNLRGRLRIQTQLQRDLTLEEKEAILKC